MNHGKNDPWPDNAVKLLRTLWAQGNSDEQIAKVLRGAGLPGLTRCAVIGKRNRLGLARRSEVKSHRTGKPRSTSTAPKRIKQVVPRIRPEPMPKPFAPERSPTSVRFIDRDGNQCAMFCAGEEGANGFVCGAEAVFPTAWCANCSQLVWQPLKQKVAA